MPDRFDVDLFAFELELLLEAEFLVRELSTDAVEVSPLQFGER